jgi:hypothetical protein
MNLSSNNMKGGHKTADNIPIKANTFSPYLYFELPVAG